MVERKLIAIEDEDFILKEVIVESNGDTVWDVKDKCSQNSFIVHSSSVGKLYITFFKNCYINTNCSFNAIKKICEILLERNLKPTINIHYTNESLIKLCCAIGFRKDKKVKNQYYLKKIKST